jgi:hypothetical protein
LGSLLGVCVQSEFRKQGVDPLAAVYCSRSRAAQRKLEILAYGEVRE